MEDGMGNVLHLISNRKHENIFATLPFGMLSSVNSKCLLLWKSKGNTNIECNRHKCQTALANTVDIRVTKTFHRKANSHTGAGYTSLAIAEMEQPIQVINKSHVERQNARNILYTSTKYNKLIIIFIIPMHMETCWFIHFKAQLTNVCELLSLSFDPFQHSASSPHQHVLYRHEGFFCV